MMEPAPRGKSLKRIIKDTKKNKVIKLMYRGDHVMDDFVWATWDEIEGYVEQGYQLSNTEPWRK